MSNVSPILDKLELGNALSYNPDNMIFQKKSKMWHVKYLCKFPPSNILYVELKKLAAHLFCIVSRVVKVFQNTLCNQVLLAIEPVQPSHTQFP